MEDLSSAPSRRVTAPDPPNLKGTAFARADRKSEFDPKVLDRFDTPAKDDA